jgi:hypothetical protein
MPRWGEMERREMPRRGSITYVYVSNKKITIIGKLAQKIAYMHIML